MKKSVWKVEALNCYISIYCESKWIITLHQRLGKQEVEEETT